jgi:hypothetical protein
LSNSTLADNGVVGSYSQHSVYTECDGVLIEGNRFKPLKPGAVGSMFEDRSAGTIVRYNWIQQSARMLDLVDAQDATTYLPYRPSYRQTFVYGNLFHANQNIVNSDMTKPIHYGYDMIPGSDRAGTLYFYNNTVVYQYNQNPG